jgi:hypothetical protein
MISLSSKAFNKMKRLRLLTVKGNVQFFQGPISFSNELRVLDWPNCPLESFPQNFRGNKLIMLRMPKSHLKGLEEVQVQLLFLEKLCPNLSCFGLLFFDFQTLVSDLKNVRFVLRL